MSTLTKTLLLLVVLLLAAGCGGAEEGAGPLEQTDTEIPTVPGPIPPTEEGEPATTATPFASTEFEPPVSFQLPAGWRVEEVFGTIQAFRGTDDRYALTLESEEGGDVDATVEAIGQTEFIEIEEPEPATVGGHDGYMITGEANESTIVEGTDYYAIQHGVLRMWILDVEGTAVKIFAEAGSLRMDARDEEGDAAFFSEVDQILASMEFGQPS
jgi:hypothetical protein